MEMKAGSKVLRGAVVCLILAAAMTPVVVLGQVGASRTQAQLSDLMGAAQASGTYAHSAVNAAESFGLTVSSAQSQLSLGDTLLAEAEAYSQTGGNVSAGIESAQEAMQAYTRAATSATVALDDARPTSSADYQLALGAMEEINATAAVVASATAVACEGVGASTAGSGSLAQVCAQVDAKVASAMAGLSQAASLLAGVGGQASDTADITQAKSLVTSAGADVNASETALAAIATYTYSQRGGAYVSAVLTPMSAAANAVIRSEEAFQANLSSLQVAFSSYASAQRSAAANVTLSASSLADAILQVRTGPVDTSLGSAGATAAQVSGNMSALLKISGILALAGVVSDVDACASASSAYQADLAQAGSRVDAYAGTNLTGFTAYLGGVDSAAAAASSSGVAYSTACLKVVSDISILQSIPGVQAIYGDLTSLDISGSVGGVNSALVGEEASMSAVEVDVYALASTVASSEARITVGNGVLRAAGSLLTEGEPFLNYTSLGAVSQASASVQATSQSADSFNSAATSSTLATVGAFAGLNSGLGAAKSSLTAQTNASIDALVAAATYVNDDVRARVAEAASGQAQINAALQFFSSLDIPEGVNALATASAEFQAAAQVSP